jgi:hypothetical protein
MSSRLSRSICNRIFAFRADTATLLSQVTPGAGKPRKRIRHPGQIHLDARFPGLGSGTENIENNLLPIRHRHAGKLLPVSLLRRAELIVENQDVAVLLFRDLHNFLGFAGADQETRVRFAVKNQLSLHDRDAQGIDKFFQLLKQTLRLGFLAGVAVRADEKRSLHHLVFGFDLKHSTSQSSRSSEGVVEDLP